MAEESPVTPITAPAPEPTKVDPPSTQDDEPKWLPERLARARATAVKDFLKELGLDSPDTLKTILTDAKKAADERKEADKANLSEVEKIRLQMAETAAAKSEAEKLLATERETFKLERLDSALRLQVAGAKYPALVVKAIYDDNEAAKLLDEDGKPNAKAIEKAVEKARTDYADLFKEPAKTPGSPSNGMNRAPDTDKGRLEKLQRAYKPRF